jgi:hypothetical protein
MDAAAMSAGKQEVRDAIRFARWINGHLQGTMSLEGRGLDRKTLRVIKRRTIRKMLGK